MPTMEEVFVHPGVSGVPHVVQGAGNMYRCAGCNATDVPLLACDDIDGNGTVSDPSQRARCVLECLYGLPI